MELKDMILQTLSEIENVPSNSQSDDTDKANVSVAQNPSHLPKSELELLHSLREKTLVLFEGLQSPQIKDLPMKLDLVINYLQYQLCMIDEKLKG
ncbi:hypothetical protein [Helicobacter sp. 11S02596-1]|uniref:CiaD-like domain-containing protein n=1 Tax=Helicobacter sp. 11S02596-1 TaxID=1476194 RepID=UPI000BA66642|nr:hypothetical protein [Helicobacter sp. 11S02596-1]PAF45081.1 hypothetical protein BJI48_00490 [Helicobacter sp. 11S02596-1]